MVLLSIDLLDVTRDVTILPPHRVYWRDRRAEQEDPPVTSTPLPPQTDTLDSAALPTAAQAPWSAVTPAWAGETQRLLAWQILHAVPCGASLPSRRQSQRRQCTNEESMCPHCQPQHALETLSHRFLECPMGAALKQWVVQLWAPSSGGSTTTDSSGPHS